MYLAKFKNNAAPVTAGEYRPFVHHPDLECGDAECHAAVIFRKGTGEDGAINTHGQSFKRNKHFATLPLRQHREGCANKDLHEDPAESGKAARETFRAAITDTAQKLIINLNGETGSGLKVRFGKAAQVEHSKTEFGQFMRAHKKNYAAISVQTLPEMIDQIRQIRELGGRDALKRTYVCHHLALRPLHEVLIGRNPDKIKALYRRMFDGHDLLAVLPDRSIGFPRLFHFVPTQATKAAAKPGKYAGNAVTVSSHGDDAYRMVLLSGLEPESEAVRTRLNAEKEILVLACPVIHPVDARQESLLYKRGEKEDGHQGAVKRVAGGAWFLYLDWVIAAEGQLESVPEPKRQLTKTMPAPLASAQQQKLDL